MMTSSPVQEMDKSGHRTSAITNATATIRDIMQNVRKNTKGDPITTKWMSLANVVKDFEIENEIFHQLTFRETLLISTFESNSSCPTPIGGLNLHIQSARGSPFNPQVNTKTEFRKNRFLLHLSSQFDHQSNNAGSRITSWIDRNLQTLEEKRTEYIRQDGGGLNEQSLYINTQKDFYYLRSNKTSEIMYSAERAHNLISEGANFILLRYLAITRHIGTFETITTYINGDLCRNIYECKGPSGGVVNNKKLDVCKIYRTIIEECGIEHHCVTLLTLQGQLLKQEWRDCPIILQINPLADISNEQPIGNERIPLENAFIGDLQLLSQYLDTKASTKKLITAYMHHHHEVRDLIADYVQAILQLKPDDIIEFTAKYFLTFTPELLPHTEYLEHDHNSCDDSGEFWRYF